MDREKHLFILFIVIMLINLVTACDSLSPFAKSAEPSDTSNAELSKEYLTIEDGRLLEYEILIPQSWMDKYELRKEENVAYYDYIASPKQTLFSIEALTAEQWQERQQGPGHGEELLTQDDIVYVYHVALDNPYSASQAEEFQQMVGQVKNIVSSLTVSIVTDPNEMVEASKALKDFFYSLSTGNYSKSAELYGGSYENLMEMNPDIDPNDHAALLENACKINGFQCLPIKQIVHGRQEWPDTFIFTLEFTNPDGSLFERGGCCGASETDMPTQSQFDFTVMRVPELGNIFLVQNLPVYVP